MIVILVLSILAAETHGTLFGDFRNIISSLQNGFQTVIRHAADIKYSIDSTVAAIENRFYLTESNIKEHLKVLENVYKNDNLRQENSKTGENTFVNGKHHSFLLYSTRDNSNRNIENIKEAFQKENDRLNSARVLLKEKLERILLNSKGEFQIINFDQMSSLEAINGYIKMLHDIEHSINSNLNINDIHNILSKASQILNIDISKHQSNDDKIQQILLSLQNRTSDIQDNGNEFNAFEGIRNKDYSNSETSVINPTLKGILVGENLENTTVKEIQININSEEILAEKHMSEIEVTTPSNTQELAMYGYVDHHILLDQSDKADTINQAKNLMEDSKRFDSILNNLFSKVDSIGSNIFDNPDLV